MSILQLATVLIYVTSVVLTSSVNDSLKTEPVMLQKLLGSSNNDLKNSENPKLETDTRSANNNESATATDSESMKQIIMEGGPIIGSFEKGVKSSDKSTIPMEGKSLIPIKTFEANFQNNDSELYEPKKGSSVVARKGVKEEKKTVGRKGVQYPEDPSINEKLTDTDTVSPAKGIPNSITKTPAELPVTKTEPILPAIEKTEEKVHPNNAKLDEKVDVIGNEKTNVTVIVVPAHPNNTSIHKKKPTSTTGEGDDDGKGMPSSQTQKQPEIGMPRKVDYIVPVVITIMATPVLGIAAFVLYTRGRDCWDKRHYRRMDFLIDGMYND